MRTTNAKETTMKTLKTVGLVVLAGLVGMVAPGLVVMWMCDREDEADDCCEE